MLRDTPNTASSAFRIGLRINVRNLKLLGLHHFRVAGRNISHVAGSVLHFLLLVHDVSVFVLLGFQRLAVLVGNDRSERRSLLVLHAERHSDFGKAVERIERLRSARVDIGWNGDCLRNGGKFRCHSLDCSNLLCGRCGGGRGVGCGRCVLRHGHLPFMLVAGLKLQWC